MTFLLLGGFVTTCSSLENTQVFHMLTHYTILKKSQYSLIIVTDLFRKIMRNEVHSDGYKFSETLIFIQKPEFHPWHQILTNFL